MKIASFPGMFALRYPYFAPEDDLGGGETDPAFVEQPGDREPDPEAAEEPAAEEPPEPDVNDEAEEEPPAAAAEDDEAPAAEAEADEEEEAPKPKKDWRDRQIIKARAAEKAAREEAAAAKQRAAELEAQIAAGAEGATVLTPAEREKIKAEAMAEISTQNRFKTINERCDAMFDAGAKAFPKTWEAGVSAAAEIFGDEMKARPDFLEAVTELDNSAAVYHSLANDPDKMEAVLQMPPHKMGIELARISAKLATAPKPKPVSKLPPPIKPLDGPTLQERSLEDLANDTSPQAQAEFNRRMDAEEAKRARAH